MDYDTSSEISEFFTYLLATERILGIWNIKGINLKTNIPL